MEGEEDSTSSYRIKDIVFFGSARRILLQSANGPCPLLALCNVLLLRNQISLSQHTRYVSFNELVEMVSGFLFDANASASTGDGTAADLRENLESCLEILPRLNVGLDVNVKFASATDFEYTRELAVFDLLDIHLFHGWLVSKHDETAFKAFGHLSYNQVVERLIAMHDVQQKQREAADNQGETELGLEAERIVEEGMLIQDFLDRTASQLSYDGLLELHEVARERQLSVFFRNSHFNTLLKYEHSLYLLCTDIAFAHSHVCWEKLDEVDGDTSYCDAQFRVNEAQTEEAAALAAAQAAQDSLFAPTGAETDGDAKLALQLMQEDLQEAQQAAAGRLQGREEQQPPQPPQQAGASTARPPGATPAWQAPDQQAPAVQSKRRSRACVMQ